LKKNVFPTSSLFSGKRPLLFRFLYAIL
jgi:hypothetical protein